VKLRTVTIPFNEEQFNIDVPRALETIERERPRVLILGSSLFLFPHPLRELCAGIASLRSKPTIQYDASHVLGLIAGKRFQQPFAEGAEIVTSSTHKTLGGPQGGILLTNSDELADRCGRALQPGLLSNHHLHRMPAVAQTFFECSERGGALADRTIAAARALAAALHRRGLPMVAAHLGYTASHTILVQANGLGAAWARQLEEANIIAGACRLPGRLGPDGVRLGTQEMVRRGMVADDTDEMATVIVGVVLGGIDARGARRRVADLAHKIAARVVEFRECGNA
jgi:glycine hydroxymethyltransferase